MEERNVSHCAHRKPKICFDFMESWPRFQRNRSAPFPTTAGYLYIFLCLPIEPKRALRLSSTIPSKFHPVKAIFYHLHIDSALYIKILSNNTL